MAGTIVATVSSRKGKGLVRINCALTCASGAITAAVIGSAFGRLVGIAFDPTAGAGATLTGTADITLTDSGTGATIWSSTGLGTSPLYFRPTAVITDNTGTAVTAAATAVDVNRDIFVAGPMKLAVANATTTDTGRIDFIFEEA